MEWIWVKNEAVNDIPGRIPADVLPAFEARGWTACPAPVDDIPADAPAPEQAGQKPGPEVKPSPSGPEKEK
jgi:hypothetical protein